MLRARIDDRDLAGGERADASRVVEQELEPREGAAEDDEAGASGARQGCTREKVPR